MYKLISTVALFAALTVSAHAGTYQEALKQCGSEWRASDQRKGVKKGEGMAAWQAYRKECTARVGWQKKGK